MAQGVRQSLVAHVTLVWDTESRIDQQRFIETGSLGGGPGDVMPYDAAKRAELIGQWEAGVVW